MWQQNPMLHLFYCISRATLNDKSKRRFSFLKRRFNKLFLCFILLKLYFFLARI